MMMVTSRTKLDPNALRRAALEVGILQREIADKSGVSVSTANRAFNGRSVGLRSARSIAEVLGVPLKGLIAREEAST